MRITDGGLMATTMKLIAKQTLGSTAASVTLSSIPATYDDLVVVASVRSATSGGVNVQSDSKMRLNGAASDTNHSSRILSGNGSSASSTSLSYIYAGPISNGNSTSNTFSSCEYYFPNYAGSNNKSLSATTVAEHNGTAVQMQCIAGLWSNSSAISQIEFIEAGGGGYASGTTFYLYGIKKS